MKNLLVELQLSNYTTDGKFILEADSGFQMCMGRVRQLLKIDQSLQIDIIGPFNDETITRPWDVYNDLPWNDRIRWIDTDVPANALMTRYFFDYTKNKFNTRFGGRTTMYDAMYVNDPMRLRHWKAAFESYAGRQPKYFVHSHFVDCPEAPKFPQNASLWWGQMEAAARADFNFWQCRSALDQFLTSAGKFLKDDVINSIFEKSEPWDDGYSTEEINVQPDMSKLRFDPAWFEEQVKDKIVIFVPNRIGGGGRSSDYTNCGMFMFEELPKLSARRKDYVVIAGNPNQKWSNAEIDERCREHGYLKLHDHALNRDEYRWLARRSHIAVGLYDNDTYGGTSARELIDLGNIPLWLDVNEYKRIASEAKFPYLMKADMSDLQLKLHQLIEHCRSYGRSSTWVDKLRSIVVRDCSYESTTQKAYEKMIDVFSR